MFPSKILYLFSFALIILNLLAEDIGNNRILFPDNPDFLSDGINGHFVKIAVIDSGIDYNHLQLMHKIDRSQTETSENNDDNNNKLVGDIHGYDFRSRDSRPYDFLGEGAIEVKWRARKEEQRSFFNEFNEVKNLVPFLSGGHGTHVSGIIAKHAPFVSMIPYRVMHIAHIIQSIDLAVLEGAKIVNISLGLYSDEIGLLNRAKNDLEDEENNLLVKLFKKMKEQENILFVVAAGNENLDMEKEGKCLYPACFGLPNVLTVGALNKNDEIAAFSNIGKTVRIFAPGVDIKSTWPGPPGSDTSEVKSGTSMSTPFVSAYAAKILVKEPKLIGDKAEKLVTKILNLTQKKIATYRKNIMPTDANAPVPFGKTYKIEISYLDLNDMNKI